MSESSKRLRVAIFVSHYQHCLKTFLEAKIHESLCEIQCIISNSEDCRSLANEYNIAFQYFPMNSKNRSNTEASQLLLLNSAKIDLVVLARYMHKFSPFFYSAFEGRMIDISSQLAPPFSSPKLQTAYERGEQIIGASAHYSKYISS